MNKPHVLIGLFTAHAGDPISSQISALTRSRFCHACFITDPARNGIYEQFAPCARFRHLDNIEINGIEIFSIGGWTDRQDVALRLLLAQRAAAQIPYWVNGLLKFLPEYRALEGEGTPADYDRHAFCSMEVFEGVKRQGVELLRAECYEVHPGLLSMSPILVPQPRLQAIF